MRRVSALALLLLLLLCAPGMGAGLPVCPGCDCEGRCLQGPCNCNQPLTDSSAREMLDNVASLVVRVVGERGRLEPAPEVRLAGPEELRLEDGAVALGTFRDEEIRLGRGLRRPEALVVLAHEYGHAWQDRFNPQAPRLTERFSVGFASWVAHVVARQTGFLALAQRFRDRSGPAYREGLKGFLEWEQVLGVQQLLDLAVSWRDFSGEEAPSQGR